MGIVTSLVKRTASKAADGIAKAAQLSQQQIADVEKKKQAYA